MTALQAAHERETTALRDTIRLRFERDSWRSRAHGCQLPLTMASTQGHLHAPRLLEPRSGPSPPTSEDLQAGAGELEPTAAVTAPLSSASSLSWTRTEQELGDVDLTFSPSAEFPAP